MTRETSNLPTAIIKGKAVQANSNHWQSWVLSILLALLPVSLSLTVGIKIAPPAVLFVVGGFVLIRHVEVRRCFGRAWPVTGAAAALVLYSILNVIGHRLGWHPLDHAAHVLLYLVIAAVFFLPLRMRLVWIGFSLTAIAFGIVCLVQHFGMGVVRAYSLNGGASSAIEFAMIMLGLALLALVQLFRADTGLAEKIVHGAGLLFGAYGALLTQSRGPLLAFVPAFAAVIVVQMWRTRRWRWALVLVITACVGAVIATNTLHSGILKRFAAVNHELVGGNPHAPADKSINERMEMWHTAERAIKQHRWFGIGIDRFNDYARKEIAAGRTRASIERFNHPHNEYLEATTGGGLPGLLVLMAAFLMPLGYFIRHLRHPDETVAIAAIGGAALIGLYMLCAVTDSVFYRVMSQSFYFFLVIGYAVLIASRTRATNSPRASPSSKRWPLVPPRAR